MTTAAAKKIQAKRARRPIYVTPMRLVDPRTGEEHAALVPAHPIDQRLCRERGYRIGEVYRAEIKAARNRGFHRLFHAIGSLLVDSVEGFEHLDSHGAVKHVQTLSGVCCETQMVDMGTIKFGDIVVPVGLVPVKVPRSMAFDEMDEDEARVLFDGITAYIGQHYTSVMLDDVRAEFWELVNGDNRRAA